ncbi:site-specific integrase [Novosphingobium sp. HII-3]|uniref:tyrosine-type recombinase/integrase n=1 Tax=Novosphingobium sp. HII-3 TaxID=2075565 RepID=UPI000CDA5505|nr:site-specific integrase [Novosphingobium sp. HII-3]
MIETDAELRKWKPTNPDLPPGLNAVRVDGARGLYARMFDTGAITWVFRFKLHGKARQMALGPYPAVSLAAARQSARDAYAKVKAGVDPIEQDRQEAEKARAAVARRITFAKYTAQYMENRASTFKTPKAAKLWMATLRDYAFPVIGKVRVNDITEGHIQQIMEPIYSTKRETARKVVQRVGAIIGAAIDEGLRDRDRLNPARPDAHAHWRSLRNAQIMDAAGRRGPQPAVPVEQVAEWFAALRDKEGIAARAVEFLALTCVRSGEVRAMTWGQVDLAARTWSIPVENSKMSRDPNRRPHVVPLSDAAIDLLNSLPRRAGVSLVFPAPRDGALSDMALSKVMRDMHAAALAAGEAGWIDQASKRPAVPHGLRSTFRTWAADRGEVQFEVAEAVLAHAVGGTTSLAYQRGSYRDQRVAVMQAWADFITGKTDAPVQVDPLAAALDVLRAAGLSASDIAARLTPAAADNVVPIRKGAA